MGFRFNRRVRILPGVTLNFSKSGVSTSFGTRGMRYTVGHGRRRTTIGIPGTGLSYSSEKRVPKRRQPRASHSPTAAASEISTQTTATIAIIVAIPLFWAFPVFTASVGALLLLVVFFSLIAHRLKSPQMQCPHCQTQITRKQTTCGECQQRISWIRNTPVKPSRPA